MSSFTRVNTPARSRNCDWWAAAGNPHTACESWSSSSPRRFETVKGYREQQSPHFRVSFPPGREELLVPFAIETLEAMRSRMKDDLGYAPPDVIRIEIYPARRRPSTGLDVDRRRHRTHRHGRAVQVQPA